MRIALDASNLAGGGGISHLVQILEAADPARHGFSTITVFCSRKTGETLPKGKPWLEIAHHRWLDGNLLKRSAWRQLVLPKVLLNGFDILFAPGGIVARTHLPTVTMSRNMLPFDSVERAAFPLFSFDRLRLELLRVLQARSFAKADGMVFLTRFAKNEVTRQMRRQPKEIAVIPHGLADRFSITSRSHRALSDCDAKAPFRLLYVSSVYRYKHQWHVVDAVAELIRRGYPLALDLAGDGDAESVARLNAAMARSGAPEGQIRHLGKVSFREIHALYHAAEGFIFASSCENMPNILLEAMCARLPIVCSDRGPMPEILGDAGLYFDPTDSAALIAVLEPFLADAQARARMADQAADRAAAFGWDRCADETFRFLAQICAAR